MQFFLTKPLLNTAGNNKSYLMFSGLFDYIIYWNKIYIPSLHYNSHCSNE